MRELINSCHGQLLMHQLYVVATCLFTIDHTGVGSMGALGAGASMKFLGGTYAMLKCFLFYIID